MSYTPQLVLGKIESPTTRKVDAKEVLYMSIGGYVGGAIGIMVGFFGGAFATEMILNLLHSEADDELPFCIGILAGSLGFPLGVGTGVSVVGRFRGHRGSFIGAVGGAYLGCVVGMATCMPPISAILAIGGAVKGYLRERKL